MILRAAVLAFSCMSLLAWTHANGNDELVAQREALGESLEQPLRAELVKNGYSPRNAAIAADSLLDLYAECLASAESTNTDSEPEVTYFPLGDELVAVYKSDCLTKFQNDLAELP